MAQSPKTERHKKVVHAAKTTHTATVAKTPPGDHMPDIFAGVAGVVTVLALVAAFNERIRRRLQLRPGHLIGVLAFEGIILALFAVAIPPPLPLTVIIPSIALAGALLVGEVTLISREGRARDKSFSDLITSVQALQSNQAALMTDLATRVSGRHIDTGQIAEQALALAIQIRTFLNTRLSQRPSAFPLGRPTKEYGFITLSDVGTSYDATQFEKQSTYDAETFIMFEERFDKKIREILRSLHEANPHSQDELFSVKLPAKGLQDVIRIVEGLERFVSLGASA